MQEGSGITSAQKPSIAQLHDPQLYEVIADVGHDEVVRFIQPHLKRLSWITAAYWCLNAAVLAGIVFRWLQSGLRIMDAFPITCLGMVAGYLVLLPIHEHVHAVAYRMIGAAETQVRYNLRRLTGFCEAPWAIVSGGEFVRVCLAPLAVLNPILAILAFWPSPGKLALFLAGGLLLHTGACSGDIALVNFVWHHRGRALFTYDDPERKRGCFFRNAG